MRPRSRSGTSTRGSPACTPARLWSWDRPRAETFSRYRAACVVRQCVVDVYFSQGCVLCCALCGSAWSMFASDRDVCFVVCATNELRATALVASGTPANSKTRTDPSWHGYGFPRRSRNRVARQSGTTRPCTQSGFPDHLERWCAKLVVTSHARF